MKHNKVKLHHNDCNVVLDDLIKDNVKFDAVITDLPYFKIVKDDWDNQWKNEKEYLKWIENIFLKIKKCLKDNGSMLIFTSRQNNRHISIILDKYFKEERIIIWKRRRSFNNTRGNSLNSGYEPICYYSNIEKPTFNNIKIPPEKHLQHRKEYNTGTLKDGISMDDVWSINPLPHNSKEKLNHPTQKPLKLMDRCVKMITNENDLILDFTMGSGSTGVSCIMNNRRFIGIESNQEYFKIAEDRINKIINESLF